MKIHRTCGAGAILVVLTLLCVGCAAGERAATSSTVADDFLAAVEAGDARAACALIAPKTREAFEFGEGESCVDSLGSLDLPAGGTVDEVEVWGDRAQAIGETDTLFLVETHSGWRVAAAGCLRTEDETYDCLLSD
ncbi:hypothetical protein [Actinophytocola gossypii]|uniref:Uncharacterized protein n=1 Tax=Actinophytocola gossypii TaxID=2812003 RepID=A0ABT2J906_9PSEU|nr:hypothetical protein [Actinophytocola gossypii]MCT2584266.1 hypothetical protein [Actinophytocola gossypii]